MGGRNASSSPSDRGDCHSVIVWLIATRTDFFLPKSTNHGPFSIIEKFSSNRSGVRFLSYVISTIFSLQSKISLMLAKNKTLIFTFLFLRYK